MAKKIIAKNKRPLKSRELIKGLMKGVYFVTSNDPKVTDPNTPFIVRVGKAEGKEGIHARIQTHQSSNFERLYYTTLTPLNCRKAYEEHKTPLKLERYIHKMFKEEYEIPNKDSWYEFRNQYHFLTILEDNWKIDEYVLHNEIEDLGNFSKLLDTYKYTNTQLSFNMFHIFTYHRSRCERISSFDWFCTSPVQKGLARPLPKDLMHLAPPVVRGIVFKDGLLYEEYFPIANGLYHGDKYREIVGGSFYMMNTEVPAGTSKDKEWEDIVIIGKEQNEITEDTPFMHLHGSKHYNNPATPIGDTLIVLGSMSTRDRGQIECSLEEETQYYNLLLEFPCFPMHIKDAEGKTIRNFERRGYNSNLTEEGMKHHAKMKNWLQELKKQREEQIYG